MVPAVEMTKERAALPATVVAEQDPFLIALGGPSAHDFSGHRELSLRWRLRQNQPSERTDPDELPSGPRWQNREPLLHPQQALPFLNGRVLSEAPAKAICRKTFGESLGPPPNLPQQNVLCVVNQAGDSRSGSQSRFFRCLKSKGAAPQVWAIESSGPFCGLDLPVDDREIFYR